MKKILIMGFVWGLLVFCLAGCTPEQADTDNLLNDVKPGQLAESVRLDGTERQAVYDFSVRLFQQSWQEQSEPTENMLISPLSVLMVLVMSANGAEGETLAQMEGAFGLPLLQLNAYLQACAAELPQTAQSSLCIANSIWLKDDENIAVQPDFLQTNAAYHGAAVYQEPFNNETLIKINDWVKTHTNGMIDGILQKISPNAIIYLINALAFEAEWEEPYNEHQVRLNVFTKEGGGQRQVNFMSSTEPVYLQDENTTGFIKYYAGRDYAFVGLLPAVGVRLDDYVASLNGEKLFLLLQNAEYRDVYVDIPKFMVDYDLEMNNVLQNMGITAAFDANLADLSGMAVCADGQNIFINKVQHKTHIEVDEHGTKAAAVTSVEMESGGMPPDNPEVNLNRPFIYLLIDCREQLPLFIGAVRSLE